MTTVTLGELFGAIIAAGVLPAAWLMFTRMIGPLKRRPRMAYTVSGVLSCGAVIMFTYLGRIESQHFVAALFWITLFVIAFRSVRD